MKKVLMILLTLAMVFSMAGGVSADITGGEAGGSDDMEVSHDIAQSFVITIPVDVAFNDGLSSEQAVTASNVLIPSKYILNVTIESDNDFVLISGSGLTVSTIPYTVTKWDGTTVVEGINDVVLKVTEGVDSSSAKITFATTEADIKKAVLSGKHTDKLEFTVGIEVDPTATDVLKIGTADQLRTFAKFVDEGKTDASGKKYSEMNVELTADIDLEASDENGNPICFDPIGSYRNKQAFKGTFDGQGHTIRNLNQNTWALNNGYYYTGDLGLGLFGLVENATIKNLNIDGSEISGESAICGVVAAVSAGETTFENIKVSNAKCADYQYNAGGIVGFASGKQTFINCHVDASTTIGGQWGDFNNANGGVIGEISESSTIYMKDCNIACRIDAVNDVVSAYQWYCYRNSGMLIGNTNVKATDEPVSNAAAPQLTCDNVIVTYGDWANYHYCNFTAMSYPYVRAEEGTSVDAYVNIRYGHPTDANGNTVVDDNHVHNDGEKHLELIVFDQLYGGLTGDRYCTYGTATHNGVTVIYQDGCTCDVCSQQQTTP